ncbi:MAG: protoporphyrinogen oxidase, partial [Deltaproteobacteria bacterium]|nr:protoporphyrinogen oxidase [Deltaproteobacteria bacterium]
MTAAHRVVIVGGGVAGLASAWLVRQQARQRGLDLTLTVLEAGREPGGHTRTDIIDGYVCEWGSNGFLDNEPATLDLIEQLGMSRRVVAADQRGAKRFIYHSGRMHELPTTPVAFLRSGIVPLAAKLRMALEIGVPKKRDDRDETVHDFGCRRLGEGFASYMLDPMVSGIFAGNTRELSLAAVFPKMAALERDHGGLFRALFARTVQRFREGGPSGGGPAGPAGSLHTFEEGMGE